MAGNQLLEPHNRLLLAASVFALVALLIFFLVWKWPALFGIEVSEEMGNTEELTTEEKLNVLAQIRSSDPEAFQITSAQKAEAMENLSSSQSAASNDSASMSSEEKLDVLGALGGQ